MKSKFNGQQLKPVGKMKGEIDDEFESFYLAEDKDGQVYMNRNPEYAQHRYDKSKGWEVITQAQLGEYKKKLHFIPQKARRLKP